MAARLVHPPLDGADAKIVARHGLWQRNAGQSTATITARVGALRRLRSAAGRPLLEITADDLTDWQLGMTHLGMQSIATYVNHVRGFYRWAKRYGHVPADPAADVLEPPRVQHGVPRPIPGEQLKVALRCATPQMRAWLALMAFCGLRCMEVVGLQRHQILETAEVPVLVIEGKGGKTRTVPVPAVVLDALRALALPAEGPVFISAASGRPYSPNRMSQKVSTYLSGLGIASTAHKLRHYYGTAAYQLSGGDIRLTQDLMGHASPATTQIYTQYAEGSGSALARLMDARGRDLLGTAAPEPEPDPQPADPAAATWGGLRLIRGGAA
jgi:integrase/recombinase XerC